MEEEKKSKKPADNAVKQQRLKAYQPIPTLKSALITFTSLFILFLVFGLAMYLSAANVKEQTERYDDDCEDQLNGVCTMKFEIDDDMDEPIYVYYEMRNFYQNHRNYVKSRSENQLRGEDLAEADLDQSCAPIVTNEDLLDFVVPDPGFGKKVEDYSKNDIDSYSEFTAHVVERDDDVAHPCGLTAATKFNDTFSLIDFDGKTVKIDDDDIAWDSDEDYKFKNLDSDKDMYKKQWTDVEDPHFMVWMRLAALPTFRKLYGVIEKDLDEGDYQLVVNNLYDVSEWDGEKHFVLTTANAFGGKNYFLGTLFLCAGGLCLLIDLVFIMLYFIRKPSMENLKW